jgi:hypothetical protein
MTPKDSEVDRGDSLSDGRTTRLNRVTRYLAQMRTDTILAPLPRARRVRKLVRGHLSMSAR